MHMLREIIRHNYRASKPLKNNPAGGIVTELEKYITYDSIEHELDNRDINAVTGDENIDNIRVMISIPSIPGGKLIIKEDYTEDIILSPKLEWIEPKGIVKVDLCFEYLKGAPEEDVKYIKDIIEKYRLEKL